PGASPLQAPAGASDLQAERVICRRAGGAGASAPQPERVICSRSRSECSAAGASAPQPERRQRAEPERVLRSRSE
ncbi:MAG: hypothetical protein ACYTFQ_23255, partial [Planctomycetota bacterium]